MASPNKRLAEAYANILDTIGTCRRLASTSRELASLRVDSTKLTTAGYHRRHQKADYGCEQCRAKPARLPLGHRSAASRTQRPITAPELLHMNVQWNDHGHIESRIPQRMKSLRPEHSPRRASADCGAKGSRTLTGWNLNRPQSAA